MRHEHIPEHLNELMAEREELTRRLGYVANMLCNAQFEYNATILALIDNHERIDQYE